MSLISNSFYHTPPSNGSVINVLSELRNICPSVRVFTAGKSLLSKPIKAVAIGNVRDNFATFFAGGFHGQEWLTTLLLIKYLDDLTEHIMSEATFFGVKVKDALSERGLVVVPLVNPDGVDIAINGPAVAGKYQQSVKRLMELYGNYWQANAAGIDINHNFDAGFKQLKVIEAEEGIISPRPGKYGGKSPNSEPETKAIVNLCRAFWFRRAFAFHSQGEEIFYNYGENTPPQSELLCNLFATSCGYTPSVATGTASHGGFKDYFINFYHRPGFTVEIGRGQNPLPIEDLEPIYARLCEMLVIATIL